VVTGDVEYRECDDFHEHRIIGGGWGTMYRTNDLRDLRHPVTSPDDDHRRVERSYLRFAGVGIEFATTIVVLTVFGIWVDGRLHTSPLFTIVLLLLGFAAATWTLIRTVGAPDRQPKKPDKEA
jgi:F0F1-type ATP synthase assembly protein I